MARLPLPTDDELSADTAALVALTAPPDQEAPRTMAVLARCEPLLGPFLGWAAALHLEGALSKRDHELLALRTALACGSDFEWGEHVLHAHNAGLTDDEIARVGRGPDDPDWPAHEAALLRATDELTAGFDVGDDAWAALADHYDRTELTEIPFVVGQYTMLSMVANAAQVGLPDGLQPVPQA
jgi:4-carboxymuconolactone decarboxylase